MSKPFAVGDRVLWISGVEHGREPVPMRISAVYGATGYGAEEDVEATDQRRIHLERSDLCRDTPEMRSKYAAILSAKQAGAVARRGVRRARIAELPRLISGQFLSNRKSVEDLEREQQKQMWALNKSNEATLSALQQELCDLEQEESHLDPEGRAIAQAHTEEMAAEVRAALAALRRQSGVSGESGRQKQTSARSEGSLLGRLWPVRERSSESQAPVETGGKR